MAKRNHTALSLVPAAPERGDVITPLADALLTVLAVASQYRLCTEAGAADAARLLQVRLALFGVYLVPAHELGIAPHAAASAVLNVLARVRS